MRKDYKLEKRKYVIAGFFLFIVGIYLVRLFMLQVVETDYKHHADSNAYYRKILYPSRGFIYDRNGELLVYNQSAYDVMMIPREVENLDTLDFCNTLGIDIDFFNQCAKDVKDRRKNPGYSTYTPQVFIRHLSPQDYARLQEKIYLYPGFYIQNRVLREYSRPIAANILGNIREVSPKEIEQDSYYTQGDYTGDLGVEKAYEKYLRGIKGEEILLRDAHGRIKGKYEEGLYDVEPQSGNNLILSIDADLQAYGEQLMRNNRNAPARCRSSFASSSPARQPRNRP